MTRLLRAVAVGIWQAIIDTVPGFVFAWVVAVAVVYGTVSYVHLSYGLVGLVLYVACNAVANARDEYRRLGQ